MFDAKKSMNQNPPSENSNEDNLLDEEDLSMEGYDKPVKKARNILFAIAAVQLIGLYYAFNQYGIARTITIAVSVGLAVIFAVLALWTSRKPFDAIITGIILYSVLIIANAIFEPASILQGLIFKVVIYVLMISALTNAKDVQRWKDSLRKK